MRNKIFILLLFFFPIIVFGQLYKCDSVYHNEDYTIMGGFKDGLKHGAWDYRADSERKRQFINGH